MSYKQEYMVRFYYGSDVRLEAIVYAYNEVSALLKALEETDYEKWVREEGFKITIELHKSVEVENKG